MRLVADVVAMRGDLARHKSPAGPLDAKLMRGGLVDLEFCVHAAQLEHGIALSPELPDAIDALVHAGHLPPAMRRAHDVLTRLLVAMRLVAPDAQEPAPPTRALVARACGFDGWEALLAAYADARQCVGHAWAGVEERR